MASQRDKSAITELHF